MVFIGEETSFELARCLDTYGVLEEFGVQLTADDFYQRWGHPMVVSYAGEKKTQLSDLIKLTIPSGCQPQSTLTMYKTKPMLHMN